MGWHGPRKEGQCPGSEPARQGLQPTPSSSGHHLYLVGGIAVPDDELPILGGADQQPVGRWQGRGMRIRM